MTPTTYLAAAIVNVARLRTPRQLWWTKPQYEQRVIEATQQIREDAAALVDVATSLGEPYRLYLSMSAR